MTFILAIFRSRSQAIDCNIKLKAMGVNAELINTPKEANVGCGLSIKILPAHADRARAVIKRGNYSAFYGFYAFQDKFGAIRFVRLS